MNTNYLNRAMMQRDLFPGSSERRYRGLAFHKPRANDLNALAVHVSRWPWTAMFDVWVVGSALDRNCTPKDIDIMLTRRKGKRIGINDIEDSLIDLRRFGIYELSVSVDVFFRTINENEMQRRSRAGLPFFTWKLESPWFQRQIEVPTSPGWVRGVGRFLVVIFRRIEETSYFDKLPIEEGPVSSLRVLRPAVQLLRYRT